MATEKFSLTHPIPHHITKPFLKWAGGKGQLLEELRNRLPEKFNRYFEPMVGSGALFFSLQPKKSFLSDTNKELVNCYRVIQKKYGQLIKTLKKHRYEEDYFYKIRNIDRSPAKMKKLSDVERAARLIFLNRTCFNGLHRVNSKGQFNVPFGEYTNPTICDEKGLKMCAHALKAVTIKHQPFEQVLKEAKRGDFVYFDPPYMPVSKTSSFTTYGKDKFLLAEHRELAKVAARLTKRGVMVMISNSYTPEVLEIFSDFKIETVLATRAINSKGAKRGAVKEVIIRNY